MIQGEIGSGYDAKLLVDALFLVLRLVNLTAQADRAGKLYRDHKLFRITRKAQNRYCRIRAEFREEMA